jgi:hypothetical protein
MEEKMKEEMTILKNLDLIGKKSLFIIESERDHKNEIWDAAVEINSLAHEIYNSLLPKGEHKDFS